MKVKITIIYDNKSFKDGLKADWGFSCFVEAHGRRILFDTGAKGQILLENMEKLGIESTMIDEIIISHPHWDHIGGLQDFLKRNSVKVYVPESCQTPENAKEVIRVKGPLEIHENIFSTGELEGIEQSLVVRTENGLVVIVGCSHPGIETILKAASQFGKVRALIGGLHGFKDFDIIQDLELVCPTHCTKFKSEIESLYPGKYTEGGAGRIIEI